jgi:NAD(P)-dependent dehydrogenase (short-subunit alcohol dehydrogenase family)
VRSTSWFASAGFVERVLTEKASPAHFDKTFGINVRGVCLTMQKALPLMRKGGSIVLVSSSLHLKGLPEHGTYAATKAAVRSLARTWAIESKDRGIRVNTLSPGAVDMPIIDNQSGRKKVPMARAFFSSITPLGRIGRPEEMASAILYLGPTTAATRPASISSLMAASRRSNGARSRNESPAAALLF